MYSTYVTAQKLIIKKIRPKNLISLSLSFHNFYFVLKRKNILHLLAFQTFKQNDRLNKAIAEKCIPLSFYAQMSGFELCYLF